MSKTPRTDSELKLEAFMDGFGIVDTVQVEFAAQLETELNTVQKNLDGLATEVGHALVLCSVDFAGGESVEPREHAIWVAVRKLISQRDEARAIVAQQKKTFVAALQNATKLSASQLRIAEQLKSESSPEMLESERAANATLTEELEKALAEIEALKCCGNCKDCFSNKNKTICKTCNRNPYGTKQTDNWSHSETKRKGA